MACNQSQLLLAFTAMLLSIMNYSTILLHTSTNYSNMGKMCFIVVSLNSLHNFTAKIFVLNLVQNG